MHRLALALLLGPSVALAQTVTLPHAGYLLDDADGPVTATSPMRFRIWDAATDGGLAWTGEVNSTTACSVSVRSGYYAVVLGADCGAAIPATAVAPGAAFLEIELAGTTLTPRLALLAAPSALQSADAIALRTRLAQGGTLNDGANPVAWTQLKGVPAGFADGLDADHTYTAGGGLALVAGEFSIAAGAVGSARLAVDADSLSAVSGGVLTSSGGAIASSGAVSAPAISVTATSASTVPIAARGATGQVANLVEARSAGGTLVTAIDKDGFLSLPGDPTIANHAATKAYVDTHLPANFGAAAVQASAPTSPYTGQLWFATGTGALSVWSGSTWLGVGGAGFGNPSTPRTSTICATASNAPCVVPAGTAYLIVDNAVYGYPTALDLSLLTGTLNVQVAAGGKLWANGGRGGNSNAGPNQGGDGANFQHWGKGGTKNNGGASATAETGADGTSGAGGASTSSYCNTWWSASGGGGGGTGAGAGGNQCNACAQSNGAAGSAGRGGNSGQTAPGCQTTNYGANAGGFGAGWGGGGGATAGGSGGGGSYGGAGGAGDNYNAASGGQAGQNGACAIGSRSASIIVNVYEADGVSLYPTKPASALGASATIAGYWFNEMSGGYGDGTGLAGGTALPSRWNGNASAAIGDATAANYYGTPTANHGYYCHY